MLTPNVDTYVTVVEADAYFDSHFGYDDWATLTEPVKEQCLRSATQKMDLMCSWYGDKCASDQPLAFPRTIHLCTSDIPQSIKDAQCEVAYIMVIQGSAVEQTEDVLTKLKAGPVELEFKGDVNPGDSVFESGLVIDLLSAFGMCAGSGSGTSVIPMLRG